MFLRVIGLLIWGCAHRHELKDNVWGYLEIWGLVYDLHEGDHLILGEEFESVFFFVRVKNIGETPGGERDVARRVGNVLGVFTEDIMKFLLNVDD